MVIEKIYMNINATIQDIYMNNFPIS